MPFQIASFRGDDAKKEKTYSSYTRKKKNRKWNPLCTSLHMQRYLYVGIVEMQVVVVINGSTYSKIVARNLVTESENFASDFSLVPSSKTWNMVYQNRRIMFILSDVYMSQFLILLERKKHINRFQ